MNLTKWTKRIGTVFVGIPTVAWILSTHAGSVVLLAGVSLLCHAEFVRTLTPAILRRLELRKAPNEKKDLHASPIARHGDRQLSTGAVAFQLAAGLAVVVSAAHTQSHITDAVLALAFVVTAFSHVATYAGKAPPSAHRLAELLLLAFGLFYVPRNFAFLVRLRLLPQGFAMFLWFLLTVWNSDNGAIVMGSMLGGSKAFPEVSPGKTKAGVAGGALGSLLTSVLVGYMCKSSVAGMAPTTLPQLSMVQFALAGLYCAVVAVFGDLVESVLKRAAGVKDSGVFLPGHGGALDRLDSLIMGAPMWYYVMAELSQSASSHE